MADLHIDGNIAQMFKPQGAAMYFSRLLQADPHTLRAITTPQWPSAFFILSPPVSRARHFTVIQGHPAWLLDYAIKHGGTVVPQRIWAPQNDTQRHVPLNMPIFFVHNDKVNLGLPVVTAATRDCMTLYGAGTPAPVGDCSTTFIRINVSDFPCPWREARVPRASGLRVLT